MNKKGLGGMSGTLMVAITAVILLFIVGFVLSIGGQLVEDLQASDSNPTANATYQSGLYNATSNSLSGFDTISGFQGTIGLIVAAVTVIGILLVLVGAFLFGKLGR